MGLVGGPGFKFQWFGDRVIAAVEQRVQTKLIQAGDQWLAMSRSLAPVDTGRLRAEESYQVIGRTLTLIMGAPYDIFTEFGTRNMVARPHVRPALNAISRVFGGSIAMEFAVPHIERPMFAHKGGFVVPRELTAKQRHHVATNLLPVSRKLHRGNVRRAKFRVRKVT